MNDQLVGHADQLDVDQPWFRAQFSPSEGFEQFRELFEAYLKADKPSRSDELADQIGKINVRILNEDQDYEYSSHPENSKTKGITSIVVDQGEIRWRPL